MKIAVFVREETAEKCIGKGCLNAFNKRLDAFSKYGAEVELIAFTHIGGDLDHKIKRLKENGVEVVHLSTCMRSKSDQYESLAHRLSKDFNVVGYTHGSEVGKTNETINYIDSSNSVLALRCVAESVFSRVSLSSESSS